MNSDDDNSFLSRIYIPLWFYLYREIWTTSYKNYPWDYVLRYGSGGGSGGGGGTEGVYIVRWIAG